MSVHASDSTWWWAKTEQQPKGGFIPIRCFSSAPGQEINSSKPGPISNSDDNTTSESDYTITDDDSSSESDASKQ
jgi:hypothetical protein